MADMKTASAETSIEIWVHCPHCTEYQNRFDDLREALDGEPRAEECNEVIKCEDCGEEFVVTEITY
jgi:ribosomal protein S27E